MASVRPEELAPEDRANLASQVFFAYASPLFFDAWRRRRAGKKASKDKEELERLEATLDEDEWEKKQRELKGELEEEDFWDLSVNDRVEPVNNLYEGGIANHVPKDGESETQVLTNSMWAVSGRVMVKAGLVKLVNTCLQFSYPFLMRELLFTLQPNSNRPVTDAYYWALGLAGAMYIKAMTENTYFYLAARGGWRAREAMTTAVYRKSLKLSLAARQTKTLGEIVNLMQLDASKIESFFQIAHSVWDGLLQVIGFTLVLFSIIGWSAFVGLAFMITLIPVQGKIWGKLMAIDRKVVKVTDERVKKANEAVQGILGVKMASWEESFETVLQGVRDQEVSYIRSTVWLKSFSSAYMMSAPALTAAISLAVYATVQEGVIDAATLFTALSTFGQLRFPLMLYPMAIAQYASFTVSRKRLAAFMKMEEVNFPWEKLEDNNGDVVKLENVTVYWSDPNNQATAATLSPKSKEKKKRFGFRRSSKDAATKPNVTAPSSAASQKSLTPVLSNINMSVKKGELVAVVGPVGQGKTALMNTILREMYLSEGRVSMVEGPYSFASQTPWIMNASVRENILFGEEYDAEWYERVLDSCQLRHDLSLLDEYDETEIGEKGVNLSGGQRARVAMARAMYLSRRTHLVLLDDILSALDPAVAAQLFEHAIMDGLDGKTRIICTNSLDILKECDRIIVIAGGEGKPGVVSEEGSFETLMENKGEFAALMHRHRGDDEDTPEETVSAPVKKKLVKSSSSANTREEVKKKKEENIKHMALMKAEERARGGVGGSLYGAYIQAGGGFLIFGFVYFLFIVSQGFAWINTYWMTLWSDAVNPDGSYRVNDLTFYLVGYVLTAVFMALSTFIRTGALLTMAVNATTSLHKLLLSSVLHAPSTWFDQTPTGRILQRFSQDMVTLDKETSENASFFLFTTLFVVTSLATIIYVTPIFAAFLVPLIAIYFGALSFYRPVMRDAKRIGSIAISPVYAHFSETLGGVVSIRALGAVPRFQEKNATYVNRAIKMVHCLKICERWLGIRLEFLGTSISFISTMLAVYSVQQGTITAGEVGLSLTFSLSTTTLLTNTIRAFAQLEASMNSVERIKYMGTQIEQEKWKESDYDDMALTKLQDNWPQHGAISITNLTVKYREETPTVLKGISFDVKAGEKIGIAGRSGSGKSSLFLTLLRIIEPQEGSKVIIDGIDTSQITLPQLRKKIAIAPQLPVLFSGTLRYNLDPFEAFTDFEIWAALEKVGMKNTISVLPDGLLAPVAESGENFSQGERQLLSLVRAVLAKPKILLLDESTASLDSDRDQFIQKSISEAFSDASMLVIAHRLDTIIQSDRILVLHDGQIAEFDEPAVLLENPDSELSKAVAEMGAGQAERMKKQASSRHAE